MYAIVPTMVPAMRLGALLLVRHAPSPRRSSVDAGGGASGRSRDAEVHDDGVVAFDHDVGGLQVAMHHARLVRGDQARRELPHDAQRLGTGSLPSRCRTVARSAPSMVRHRDVLDAVDFAEVVNADDVLVRDLPREQQLLLEAALDARRLRVGRCVASGRMTFSATTTSSSASHA